MTANKTAGTYKELKSQWLVSQQKFAHHIYSKPV